MSPLTCSDVTVVIPARDAAETLAATLQSITDQEIGRPHLIVVDDGSSDDTTAVAEKAGAVVIRIEGEGPGAARNHGIEAATTPIIAFCDADDLWPSERLLNDLAAFDADPELDVLLGRTHFDTDDDSLLEGHHFKSSDNTAEIPHFGAATMRLSVFDKAGLIDAERTNYEDYEWFFRARDLGCRVVSHPRVSQSRWMHAGSTSQLNPASPSDLMRVIQQSIVRRRAASAPSQRAFWFLSEFPPDLGGIASYAAALGPTLARLGNNMTFLIGSGGPSRGEFEGIEIIREPLLDAFGPGSPRDVLRCRRLVSTLKAEIDPTVYHVHLSDPTPMLHLATSTTAPAPTVLTLHNEMLSVFSPDDPDSLMTRLLANASVITGVSTEATIEAADAVPNYAHRLVTIPNGIAVPDDCLPLPKNSNILATGRLAQQKAFDRVIKTMPSLLEHHPHAHLDILGEGPDRPKLESLIDTLGIAQNVTLHGHVPHEDVAGFLARAQVVVAPSHHEGLPYALLEGAAAGRPIVASQTGGINEIVLDGETGLLVEKDEMDRDVAALGRAIGTVLGDPDLAQRFGSAGRARVEEFLSIDRCARSYDHVYRAVTAPAVDLAVIIPAWNAQRHLAMTLDSVLADTAELDATVQILVVDDGSTDETSAVAERYADRGVELFRQPNLGTPMARNAGIALTRSRYIAHLDADDLWPAGRLATLLAGLEADPEVDAVFGQTVEFADSDAPASARWNADPVAVRMLTVGLIRRSVHDSFGGFAPARSDDQMGWMATALANGLHYSTVEEVVLQRRIHATNKSHGQPFSEDLSRVAVVKAALDARRRRSRDAANETDQSKQR